MRSIILKAGLAAIFLSTTLAGASAAPAFSLVQSEQHKIGRAADDNYPATPLASSPRIATAHYPASAKNASGKSMARKHHTPLQHEIWLNQS